MTVDENEVPMWIGCISLERKDVFTVSVEECVRLEKCSLLEYLKRTNMRADSIMDGFLKDNTMAEQKQENGKKRMEEWKGKVLHGQ